MLAPSASMNTKHAETLTPIAYTKDNLKVPARKLWQTKNEKSEFENDNWNAYRNSDKDEKWDVIESPQFVDFTNLPDIGDSFFNKFTAVVSTPNPNFANTKYPNKIADDNTLIASFNNISLSNIKYDDDDDDDEETCVNNDSQKQETEEYVVRSNNIKRELEINNKVRNKVKKPQKVEVYPFTFDLREQHKQKQKQERLKKLLEEETKKVKIFRANPVPNFIKSRIKTINNHNNNEDKENKLINDKNKLTSNDLNKKIQKSDNCDKQIKNNIEVWKKPPFVPCLTKKKLQLPQTPLLHTVIRAQERKLFNDTIKEKERLKEEKRQMEIAAKKKQEEEEIALLRKKTVHKAQPIRKYKMSLPKVDKRPLTDPVSPLLMKRRRRI